MSIFGFGWLKKNKKDPVAEMYRENREYLEKVEQGHKEIAGETKAYAQESVKVAQNLDTTAKNLDRRSERLTTLIEENEAEKRTLLERDARVREGEVDIEERMKEVRRQEINIEARKSEARNLESGIKRQIREVESEKEDTEKRMHHAESLAQDSQKSKDDYEEKSQKLSAKESDLDNREEDISVKEQVIDKRDEDSRAIYEEAESKRKEAESAEKEWQEAEQKLQEKMAKIDAVKSAVESVEFDSSDEGKRARIAAQEAIRQAKKTLEDQVEIFDKLQENYCQGSFKGFYMLISDIDGYFKELQNHAKQVKEHAEELKASGIDLQNIVDAVDKYLLDASKSKKAWEFSEAFKHICFGLATCKNYETLADIIAGIYQEGAEEDESSDEDVDYYQILGVKKGANKEEIEKAYRKKAQKCHPDMHETKSDEVKAEYVKEMQELNDARKKLLAEIEENKYNKKGHKK